MELEKKLLPATVPESCLCSAALASIMGQPSSGGAWWFTEGGGSKGRDEQAGAR